MSKRKYNTKRYRLQDKQIRKVYNQTGGVDVDGDPITYRQFKHQVTAEMKSEHLTARKAAIKVKNTETFTTAAERSRYNLTEAIKREFPQEYQEMTRINRGLRNDKGQFTAMYQNLKWNKEYNSYVLGDYVIDVSNSPKGVFVTPIDKMRRA